MQPAEAHICPAARREGLVVTQLGDETLIYDLERHRAHRLDAAAAALWRACDGRTPVHELSGLLHAAPQPGLALDAAWFTLARLGKAHLLDASCELPLRISEYTRRELLRRAAVAGMGIVLPSVLSIAVPTTAQAQVSCLARGTPCVPGGIPCCPGLTCRGAPNKCL